MHDTFNSEKHNMMYVLLASDVDKNVEEKR